MIEFNPKNVDINVITGFKGVLVIGDPLLGPRKRVGRVDDAWDASLNKLEQALEIAKENELLPLIVGDILHNARDIGQLLPLIQLLKGRRSILLPNNTRWNERGQGHMAAILQASGVSQVAGFDAKRFQVTIPMDGMLVNMMLEAHTPWGGFDRLEPGARPFLNIPELGVRIEPSSGMPKIDGDDAGSKIEAGRLIRLSAHEESMAVCVFSLGLDGVAQHPLTVVPVVFSESSGLALDRNLELGKDSLFVERLRASTQERLEEEGKSGLFDLVDEVCNDLGADDWIKSTLLSLAKDVAEQ